MAIFFGSFFPWLGPSTFEPNDIAEMFRGTCAEHFIENIKHEMTEELA